MHWILLLSLLADIEGRWYCSNPVEGGIGAHLDFYPGGELRVIKGKTVLLNYRVEGSELVMPMASSGDQPVRQVIDLRVPNVLRLWQGNRMTAEWRRVGKAKEGILGEWAAKSEIHGVTLEPRIIFYENGQSLFILKLESEAGKWRRKQGKLEIQWPNGRTSTVNIDAEGGRFSIPGKAQGEELIYFRY